MLLPIALALLAQPLVGAPRLAVRPGPPEFDPQQMICKYREGAGLPARPPQGLPDGVGVAGGEAAGARPPRPPPV